MPRRELVGQGSEYPLSPLRLSLSMVTDLTHQDVGPSSGVIFNVINCEAPYAYFLVVFLDFLSALAVKRSFLVDSPMPMLFESAWRNPGQGYRSPMRFSEAALFEEPSSEEPSSDPLFPQGVGINLLIDAPFRIRGRESSTVFVCQIMDFPKAPPWIPPVIALIIYIVTCIQSIKKERRKLTE